MEKSFLMLWFILFVLSVQCVYITSSKLAPALYVFGDSTVDAGNNNHLQTKAKADYLPYGIDFNNTPTGRFSNGMTSADFFARFLGLPFPPAYMNVSETERSKITTGLNYASASCGILPSTGSIVGTCLSFDKQIELFETTIKNKEAKDNLGKSIIYISIAANDYTLNYLNEGSENSRTYKPDGYAKFLTDEFVKRLKTLYGLGARKFLVNGIGQMGCIPLFRYTVPNSKNCVESVNFNAILYNDQLSSKLQTLRSQLPNSFFVYADNYKSYEQILDAPQAFGMTNVINACWDQTNKSLCPERFKYLFFDNAHATEHAQEITATLCFNHTTMCSPLNILQLASA